MLAPVRRLVLALALGGVVVTAGCASMGPGALTLGMYAVEGLPE